MVSAISSGLPTRLSGTVAAKPAFLSGVPAKRFSIAVSIGPGATRGERAVCAELRTFRQLGRGENRKGHRVRHHIGLELIWGLVHLSIVYLLRKACFRMPVEGATSAQRNIADHYQHCGWIMDNGALRLARDHATKGRHYDTVEGEVVKAIVRSHAARHVGGIVKPLKKTVIIEIKCLASGMGGNLRWEDHAEPSPGLTILLVSLYFFDLTAGLSQ